MKIDREIYGEKMSVLPQRPIPQIRSPYIDTRYFAEAEGKRLRELLPEIERALPALDFPWPADVDRGTAIRECARGVYLKMLRTLPAKVWEKPFADLRAQVLAQIDPALAGEILAQVRRSLQIGELRATSYDLDDEVLVASDAVATAWTISKPSAAKLAPVSDQKNWGELHYDFTHGEAFELSQTFQTKFPIARLHRLQLSLRDDDTWHALTCYIEKLGVLYRAEKTHDLADFRANLVIWQEPGPDDRINKVRNWITLREFARGASYEADPHQIKIRLELQRRGQLGAWWAKVRRNYQLTFDNLPFWRYAGTSLFLVLLNVVFTMFSSSLVAYSFARLQWPGRNFCFALMLATMMIPSQVTMIPNFLIIRALGWYNTLYPLWIGSVFAGAFNVFLLRQFLKGVPRDLEDAAKIDGCGFWRVYWHLMLPLVRPTLAAIAIFTFLATWNDFMGPLIYLNDQRLYPLSLGLYALNVSAGAGNFGMMMAGSLLMTLPVVAIFFFAQRYFLQGVTLTGMKG